jgi:hypothetical protein
MNDATQWNLWASNGSIRTASKFRLLPDTSGTSPGEMWRVVRTFYAASKSSAMSIMEDEIRCAGNEPVWDDGPYEPAPDVFTGRVDDVTTTDADLARMWCVVDVCGRMHVRPWEPHLQSLRSKRWAAPVSRALARETLIPAGGNG